MDSIYQVAQDYFQHRRENTSLSDQYFVDRLRNMGKNEDSCVLIMEELEFDWNKLIREEREFITSKKNMLIGLFFSSILCGVVWLISLKGGTFFRNVIGISNASIVVFVLYFMLDATKKNREIRRSQKRRNQKWEDWT